MSLSSTPSPVLPECIQAELDVSCPQQWLHMMGLVFLSWIRWPAFNLLLSCSVKSYRHLLPSWLQLGWSIVTWVCHFTKFVSCKLTSRSNTTSFALLLTLCTLVAGSLLLAHPTPLLLASSIFLFNASSNLLCMKYTSCAVPSITRPVSVPFISICISYTNWFL